MSAMQSRWWIGSVFLLLGVTAAGASAAPAPGRAVAAVGVPALAGDAPGKEADAKAQLRKADEARRAIRGKGVARREGAEIAAAAYEAVLSHFPDAKSETSTAAFRLGELRRQLGDLEAAKKAFAQVVAIGGDRRLSARAVLETAHVLRRAKELGKAMDAYRRVATDFADEAPTRDDALYWIGSLHAQAKDLGKAREAWQAVADRGADPLDRVRAFDRIARTWIQQDDLKEAARTIEAAKLALHDVAADPSTRGARVRKALDRMKAVRDLERRQGKPEAGKDAGDEDADEID